MQIVQLIKGINSCIPLLRHVRRKGTGGSDNARYCYSVWLRHLCIAHENGLNTSPHTIAELGPGDSLGTGIAALISGSERYFAFDVVEHNKDHLNLQFFNEIVDLFRSKCDIPNDDEFPHIYPKLTDYSFPVQVLDEKRLEQALEESRLRKIQDSLYNHSSNDIIQYIVPWNEKTNLSDIKVDVIFSQAVMEHVEDIQKAYASMSRFLNSEGYISHQIDFKSHGTTKEWNGHWFCSDLLWLIMKGKRPFLINRQPHSAHIKELEKAGFKILCDIRIEKQNKLNPKKLNTKFHNLASSDLVTSGAFIQATLNNDSKSQHA